MFTFAVIVLGALVVIACLVAVRALRRWAEEYCDGMICAFGLPPLGEKTKTERVYQSDKESICQWIVNGLFKLPRLVKLATSYLLS